MMNEEQQDVYFGAVASGQFLTERIPEEMLEENCPDHKIMEWMEHKLAQDYELMHVAEAFEAIFELRNLLTKAYRKGIEDAT